MDVNVAVTELIEHLECNEREEAADKIADIVQWMNRKGFAPELKYEQVEFLFYTLADLLRKQA